MAHNRSYKPEDIAFPDQVITENELVREMQTSYIDYAMSVIVGSPAGCAGRSEACPPPNPLQHV